jgi:hypothetical protein
MSGSPNLVLDSHDHDGQGAWLRTRRAIVDLQEPRAAPTDLVEP